jgi:uncharacterized protein
VEPYHLPLDPDAELPSVIPIFPLQGSILPPHGQLPLNIFEPRYTKMLRDVMTSDRLIGVLQPRDQSLVPPLYDVGGLGRVTNFAPAEDGQFHITLSCITRFAVRGEVTADTPYRKVEVDYSAYRAADRHEGQLTDAVREALLVDMKDYLLARGFTADWTVVARLRDEVLVNALSMMLPFQPEERQALLESFDTPSRTELLRSLMGFAIHAAVSTTAKH